MSLGTAKQYSTNIIAENMLTQVGNDGFTMTMIYGIIDYKVDKNTAVLKYDMYIATRCGQKKLRKTTCDWKLLVKWKDKCELWIHLKDLKE